MARSVGRDQLGPMERLVRILICLADAGQSGAPVERLLRMADLPEDTDAARAQLRRELSILRRGGWQISNVAPEGSDARYVLAVHDNRLAVLLTPGERAALRMVLEEAYGDRSAPPPFFGELQHAVSDGCLTSFVYRGTRRTVHPDALYATPSGWVLTAREQPEEHAKEFVAAWISALQVGDPGTAQQLPDTPPAPLDPMTWPLEAPYVVRLAARSVFVDDVLHQLPAATVVEEGPEETIIELAVTNRAAFRARLYALGLRVRVVEGADTVARVVANLRAVANLRTVAGLPESDAPEGAHGDLR